MLARTCMPWHAEAILTFRHGTFEVGETCGQLRMQAVLRVSHKIGATRAARSADSGTCHQRARVTRVKGAQREGRVHTVTGIKGCKE
eukprot:scaffold242758_cov21-Tisochrysis_lutea.AAC.1